MTVRPFDAPHSLQLLNQFSPTNSNGLQSDVVFLVRILALLGLGSFIIGVLQVYTWAKSGQRQTSAIRVAYFRALMRQEIGWYDRHSSGALSTQIAESLPKIQDAISDKVCCTPLVLGSTLSSSPVRHRSRAACSSCPCSSPASSSPSSMTGD